MYNRILMFEIGRKMCQRSSPLDQDSPDIDIPKFAHSLLSPWLTNQDVIQVIYDMIGKDKTWKSAMIILNAFAF